MRKVLKPSEYTVKAGRHQYTPNRFRLWWLRRKHGLMELTADVSFSDNTKNPTKPEHQRLQINKLFGFSWWARMNNRHSVRVGWRVLPGNPDEVEWFLYFRRRGVMSWVPVTVTKKQSTNISLVIIPDRKANPNSTVIMVVRQGTKFQTIVENFDFPQFFGYLAEPYFGGQGAAGEPMTLTFTNYQIRSE